MEFDLEEQENNERLKLDQIRNSSNHQNVKFNQFDSDMLSLYYMLIEQWQENRRMETDPVERKEYSEFVNLCIRSVERIITDPRT